MQPLFNHPRMMKRRRQLRRNHTIAEQRLWWALRNRRLDGYKFFRQYSVNRYVLDFYCPARALAVEVDGGYHTQPDAAAYDARRTAYLNRVGIEVLRFKNQEVLEELGTVLKGIVEALGNRNPSARWAPPLQRRGGP